ncbi:hypothetical protein A2348_04725 [Candidatus Uhrbacteria bacterium RIFOXYB12_FULL_58_10]|uniref:Nudix hydrolase domain-containing protein n=1 Tax=Candidatus Uhrbacteria bacterium RIFOXYB2_FULL_57_15 TaxID=1802422 RepID=A0A1F7W8Q6_9BACT|nr:MAG: hypothetical protein A2348_04725 [Candidatus Uhrbacteria bacterium RIFOXYB12_FULL_58_10]OGL98986.1 MAG: hypothetical protein A2501_02535 [Candidatus Uhrbacteria bacterium RIFOXYC12_FULL_57_11]OGL99160.1 MAG: hypothetical protein A2304_03265 [Candidatus Uhrbacteria bacterium RIFOXYB2_FULL_57_15]
MLSADIVVLYKRNDNTYDILLIRRGGETERGKLALPGGKKNAKDGTIAVTAQRELYEEVGIHAELDELSVYGVLDGPGRDPRGDNRTSIVHILDASPAQVRDARAGDDASELVRMPLANVQPNLMAFDHAKVIERLQSDYA